MKRLTPLSTNHLQHGNWHGPGHPLQELLQPFGGDRLFSLFPHSGLLFLYNRSANRNIIHSRLKNPLLTIPPPIPHSIDPLPIPVPTSPSIPFTPNRQFNLIRNSNRPRMYALKPLFILPAHSGALHVAAVSAVLGSLSRAL
jgi:hypothetical protein